MRWLRHHPQGMKVHVMVWWVWKLSKSHAMPFTVTRVQPSWSHTFWNDVLDSALHYHHQSTNWKKIFWKNSIQVLQYISRDLLNQWWLVVVQKHQSLILILSKCIFNDIWLSYHSVYDPMHSCQSSLYTLFKWLPFVSSCADRLFKKTDKICSDIQKCWLTALSCAGCWRMKAEHVSPPPRPRPPYSFTPLSLLTCASSLDLSYILPSLLIHAVEDNRSICSYVALTVYNVHIYKEGKEC